MDGFTAKNALLTGTRLIGGRPLLVLSWAALFLVRTIVFAVLYQGIMVWALARGASGAPLMALQLPVTAFALVKTAASLVLSAVVLASAFRAIFRPRAPAPLCFGREELLVLASQVFTQLVAALPVLAILAGTFLVHGLGSVLSGSRWIVTVFETLGLFWSVVASVWAFARLEIAPFRCWAIARGRFWLLGGLVLGVLVLRLLANAGVNGVEGALSHSLSVTGAAQLLQYVMSAILEALEIALLAGIVCTAYGARPPEPQAAAFSTTIGGPAS